MVHSRTVRARAVLTGQLTGSGFDLARLALCFRVSLYVRSYGAKYIQQFFLTFVLYRWWD